ncbi:hypothetical protein Taro_042248 [Colocasia esculenta]|uniref:non-specific serine/threonine protein kinase n=1 Tax=Colocasia esculenta TaxID=4460 RepID=A0A843WY27_COLES|nr:hypothetical protein [Colocasia esculenta]
MIGASAPFLTLQLSMVGLSSSSFLPSSLATSSSDSGGAFTLLDATQGEEERDDGDAEQCRGGGTEPRRQCGGAPPSPAAKPNAACWEVSAVLSRLSHPILPSLLGRLETPDLLAWVLPYCPSGDLNALRHSHSADDIFSPSATRFYLCEVLLALSHLHSLGIVYRDLKPENILVQVSSHPYRLRPLPPPPAPAFHHHLPL